MFYKNNPKFLKSIWSAIHSINNSFFTSNFICKKMSNLNLVVFYKTSPYGNITFNQIKNIKCIYFAPYDFNKDKFDSEFKISKKSHFISCKIINSRICDYIISFVVAVQSALAKIREGKRIRS